MKRERALLVCLALLAACGGGDGNVGVYASVGYSPWTWGPCCYPVGVYGPPPVAVAPPPGGRPPGASPPRPAQPIARPPSAAPRPAAPRGGGGRRR